MEWAQVGFLARQTQLRLQVRPERSTLPDTRRALTAGSDARVEVESLTPDAAEALVQAGAKEGPVALEARKAGSDARVEVGSLTPDAAEG